MEFRESVIFTKRVLELLSDDDYSDLQHVLSGNPFLGRVIRGGHGLRKIRWISSLSNRGKSGGIRVIYYYISGNQIYMLFAYAKNEQENLRNEQLNALYALVKKESHERQ